MPIAFLGIAFGKIGENYKCEYVRECGKQRRTDKQLLYGYYLLGTTTVYFPNNRRFCSSEIAGHEDSSSPWLVFCLNIVNLCSNFALYERQRVGQAVNLKSRRKKGIGENPLVFNKVNRIAMYRCMDWAL